MRPTTLYIGTKLINGTMVHIVHDARNKIIYNVYPGGWWTSPMG